MKNKFNKAFWANKYANNLTGWDIGSVSTPLKGYFDQLDNKAIKILNLPYFHKVNKKSCIIFSFAIFHEDI